MSDNVSLDTVLDNKNFADELDEFIKNFPEYDDDDDIYGDLISGELHDFGIPDVDIVTIKYTYTNNLLNRLNIITKLGRFILDDFSSLYGFICGAPSINPVIPRRALDLFNTISLKLKNLPKIEEIRGEIFLRWDIESGKIFNIILNDTMVIQECENLLNEFDPKTDHLNREEEYIEENKEKIYNSILENLKTLGII